MLYVITSKLTLCMQEKMLELNQNFRRSPCSHRTTVKYSKNSQRCQKAGILLLRVGNCYSMPPHDYRPGLASLLVHMPSHFLAGWPLLETPGIQFTSLTMLLENLETPGKLHEVNFIEIKDGILKL